MAMMVTIKSRKLIKPSIPTSPTLRYYKIGFIDELAPKENISLVLFFGANISYNQNSVTNLQEALGNTLTLLYPLAGRYMKDTRTVDCNDQGVDFIQAQVDTTLHETINPKMNLKLVNECIPLKAWAADEATDTLLAAQVTKFQCGGVALGVSMAHRIGDASTVCTFLNHWAASSRGDRLFGISFKSSLLFPARGLPSLELGLSKPKNEDLYVTKKLVFGKCAISNMKAEVMRNGKIRKISKAQVVSALIWKAIIGVDCAIQGNLRDSLLAQPTNLREKTESPIHKDTCGNVWGLLKTPFRANEMSMEFEELAYLLTDSIKNSIDKFSKVSQDSNEGQTMIYDTFPRVDNSFNIANVIVLSSWCRFPFCENDFGFGKPVCWGLESIPMKRRVCLVDDAGGDGVEAYVHLDVKEVPYFEQDVDIKAFAA